MTPDPATLRRRRTHLAGQRAERTAVLWLALGGYRILARRYHVRGGEIDIVARRGTTIAVVEVQARPTLAEARSAVTPHKRRRIARAAAVWLARHPWAAGLNLRGDLIAIAPWRWPVHVRDAFELDHREGPAAASFRGFE